MPSSWISLTSLLLITFVFLSITSGRAEGKRGNVEKVGKGQSLGLHTGKEGPGKAKLKLKKRKQKQRKTKSKKVKVGKNEHKSKTGKGKHGKAKRKGTKNKKQNNRHSKDTKIPNKHRKMKKKNGNRKLKTKKEKPDVEANSDNEDSIEKESARQIAKETADPDRYKHCDYLDLVEVGYRQDSICKPGDKMVFKGGKGIRRQFLMTPQTNVVVFLETGKKVTSCNNTFNDITSKVRCKPVNGLSEISGIEKTNGGATCLECPARSEEGCTPPEEQTPTVASDTEVHCRCPEERTFICTYRVESNGNSHTVTCNRNTVTKIYCGSDLVAKTTVNNPVERYSQPLCTTKEYTSILIDLKFSCKDKSIPVPSCEKCEGECETEAPEPTTSGPLMTTVMPRRFRDFRIFRNL